MPSSEEIVIRANLRQHERANIQRILELYGIDLDGETTDTADVYTRPPVASYYEYMDALVNVGYDRMHAGITWGRLARDHTDFLTGNLVQAPAEFLNGRPIGKSHGGRSKSLLVVPTLMDAVVWGEQMATQDRTRDIKPWVVEAWDLAYDGIKALQS